MRPSFDTGSTFTNKAGRQYFDLFIDALQADLDKTLIAKGFTVSGPYASLDDMAYPEKKTASLALSPQVTFVFAESYEENSAEKLPFGGHQIKQCGTLAASAVVKFAIVEPLSAQKIWLKTVEIPQETAAIDVDLMTNAQGNLNKFNKDRDNRKAVVVDVLNRAYPIVLGKFWTYLNGEEIREVLPHNILER